MFQLIFVSTGRLSFECRDAGREVRTQLASGDVLVLRKGSNVALSSPQTGYGGVCYLDYEAREPHQSGFSFSFRGGHWLVELIGLMQFALAHPNVYAKETVTLLGKAISRQAIDEGLSKTSQPAQSPAEYWTDQIKHIIQGTMYADHDDYRNRIAALELSYRQLSRYFKQETGSTIKRYHIGERIREAKRLLLDAGLSITAVAHELNFSSSQKFAAQFKLETGMTPREFRRTAASGAPGAPGA